MEWLSVTRVDSKHRCNIYYTRVEYIWIGYQLLVVSNAIGTL